MPAVFTFNVTKTEVFEKAPQTEDIENVSRAFQCGRKNLKPGFFENDGVTMVMWFSTNSK